MAVQRNNAAVRIDRKAVSDSEAAPPVLETSFRPGEQGLVLAALNRAISEVEEKRDALAVAAGMSKGQFSKVTTGRSDRKDLQCVIDALPHDVFVRFMEHLGRARGVQVREIDTRELTEEFLESVQRMVALGKLLMVRRASPLKAGIRT